MACPGFIHIQQNGDVWFSLDTGFAAPGTNVAVYRVYESAATQRLGTISGNSGAYAASGSTGKFGKEIV
jgi:hypothetical protein